VTRSGDLDPTFRKVFHRIHAYHPRRMATQLLGKGDLERARRLIEAQGLRFEPGFDDLVGAFAGGELVAVGARRGDVLKMIAIAAAEQGGPLLGALVGELSALARAAGHEDLFVFTRPASAGSFEALGFQLVAASGRAALLEWGGGLARWLDAHRALVTPGVNGAVVVNCNPFTLGHRHLVAEAARRVDTLYVMVVREDRSAFPFDVRLRLVREGTADLANVRVLDTSRYAVSALTFPAYFLAPGEDAAEVQMELDLTVFARRIAPFFGIRRRFFGTEPYCPTTRGYNAAMRRILPALGVEAVELERRTAGGEAISASGVRARLRDGRLEGIEALVPPTTAAFLRSGAAAAVRERLRRDEGRHG
jgi:[citrate (pro-3S)-lyase] ligase